MTITAKNISISAKNFYLLILSRTIYIFRSNKLLSNMLLLRVERLNAQGNLRMLKPLWLAWVGEEMPHIGIYIADFYGHEKLLIIELDGSIHVNQQTQDSIRENWLQSNHLTVIRFSNEQIFNDIELVLHTIAQALIP